jgi:DNA N-6-adenine-methyltransferase (Dam)
VTLGSHQRSVGVTQTHLTPRWIIEALGPFDLDSCAADPRPWDCAEVNLCEANDGLRQPWAGRVWLNPPFDRYQVGRWIGRLAEHGRGTALLHARTETEWFRICWERATTILFMAKRITFVKPDGTPCTNPVRRAGQQRCAAGAGGVRGL